MNTTLPSETGIVHRLFALVSIIGSAFAGFEAFANPSGPRVNHGSVQFQGLGTARLDVMQSSRHAIINWQQFNIGKGEVTTFLQPGVSSVALNRVNSGNPTAIHGSLRANGGVIVVNPNGIVVHDGGTVDVAGMLALSTLDVEDGDFLDGGPMRFRGKTAAGVRNYGAISSERGDVVLLGNFLQNAGTVDAPRGVVAFGAGGEIIVDQAGGATISVVSGGAGGATGIENSGEINGAAAELRAHGNAYALAIRNDGLVRANGYKFRGGKLTLSAGPQSRIVNTGTLQARTSTGAGGRVEISGDRIEIVNGRIDASGDEGKVGGSVAVSGGEISVGEAAELNVGGSSGGTVALVGSEAVELDGRVDASANLRRGGSVDVTAPSVMVGSTAVIHASGQRGGGSVRIGGGLSGREVDLVNATDTAVSAGAVIRADAAEGDGGRIIVFGEGNTIFEGELSARSLGGLGNGGFIEVSGRENLRLGGSVSTLSANGRNGTFLIDPVSVRIHGPGQTGTLSDAALRDYVANNHVIIHTSGAGDAQGNIEVAPGAKVIYDSPNSLTFLAHDSILVDGDIKNIGTTDLANTGHITLVAGWDGTLPGSLPNASGDPQALTDHVSAVDFIQADGRPLATPGRFGNWGAAGSRIFLNSSGLEAVEVGSARGETNLFADQIQLRHGFAEGRFTQVGYRRVGDSRDAVYDPANLQFGAYFDNPDDQIVDGNINVSGLSFVFLRPSDQFNTSDLNKIHARAYTMIGHGGIRRSDNSVDFHRNDATGFGFGYDSGYVGVDDGDNRGDITVFAGRSLDLVASRLQAQTQIGHGGHGGGTPNNGNVRAGLGTAIVGDQSGAIRITAGQVNLEGGLLSDAPVQIGHGGFNVRGEHGGAIDVTTTFGGIRGIGAPDLGGVGPTTSVNDFRWTNNRDRSYVMIGHGGYSSFHPSALPFRNLPVGTGGSTSYAGDGIAINPETGLPYGHYGDIRVRSARGVHFTATGNLSFAMIGHGGDSSHGDHRGHVTVDAASGDVIFDRIAQQIDLMGRDRRNVGVGAFVQIGHGGRRSTGGGTSDIRVTATGDIEFYAGRNEAHAMIGHGGRGVADSITVGGVSGQRNSVAAAGTHSGDITVMAGGDIKFRGGFGAGSVTSFAMVGHGGYRQYADILENADSPEAIPFGGGASRVLVDADGNPVLDGNGLQQLVADETQQGHNGDITLSAGGDVDFRAGQVEGEILPGQEPFGIEQNGRVNFVMIGHGGDESFGDHWGNVNITAGDDVMMEARGGWDGVTIFGANETGIPRLGQVEDNGTTGDRNFAQIGHGGFNANHRVVANNPAHVSGTGKNGEGIGVWGASDIRVAAGGDIVLKAARKETVGPKLVKQAFLQTPDNSTLFYTDQFGNPVDLSEYSQHSFTPTVLNRSDGNTWILPDPVMSAVDSFVQVGNGGRASHYLGGVDGEGHRGNVSLIAGGAVTLDAGDIKVAVAHGETVAIRAFPTGGDPVAEGFLVRVGPGTPDGDLTGVTQTSGNNQRSRSFSARNYAQIGNGGYGVRGDHLGDLSILAGRNAAGVGLRVHAGEGTQDYAQIGNGGYNASGYNPNGVANNVDALLGDVGDRGNIDIRVVGNILVQSGGVEGVTGLIGDSTAATLVTNSDSIYNYAKIGNGGDINFASHSGDISVVSTGGGLDLLAGHHRYGSATIGHGGYDARAEAHHGDIRVVVKDDISIRGAVPIVDPVTGHISMTMRSSAQIGHGGYASNARSGNLNLGPGVGGHYGDIEVVSVSGSVTLQGGGDPTLTQNSDNFSMNLAAQIGHGGGVFTHGDHRGDIRVVAGRDVAVLGGAGGRDSFTQIGHGGLQMSGNLDGDIEVIAGRHLIVSRGADTDTGSSSRNGAELYNNWAKIGHGDHVYRQRSSGAGQREGHISVSVGHSLFLSDPTRRPFADSAYTRTDSDQVLIGHIPSRISLTDPLRSLRGNTYLAVGRNQPHAGGPGQFVTYEGADITSAGEGLFGDLRIYMPDSTSNRITENTYLNGAEYTRRPVPGSGRADEQFATEHSFGRGDYGELDANFTPEGDYPFHGFGFYNLYYADKAPEEPGRPDITLPPSFAGPSTGPSVSPDVFGFFFGDIYDSFERSDDLFYYDGYDEVLQSVALTDPLLGENDPSTGTWIFEELLDGSFGPRRHSRIGEDPTVLVEEDEEERRRRRQVAERQVGRGALTYYVYDPATHRYSSYRVFGAPQADLTVPEATTED